MHRRRTVRRLRRLTVAATALTVTLALAGCGSGGGSGSDPDTITVAYQRTSQFTQLDDVLNKAKTEYEAANKGKTVELVPIEAEQDQYFTKLALMNGSAGHRARRHLRGHASRSAPTPPPATSPRSTTSWRTWDDWGQFDDTAKQAGLGDDGKTYGVRMGTDTRAPLLQQGRSSRRPACPPTGSRRPGTTCSRAARTIKTAEPDVIPMNIYGSKAAGRGHLDAGLRDAHVRHRRHPLRHRQQEVGHRLEGLHRLARLLRHRRSPRGLGPSLDRRARRRRAAPRGHRASCRRASSPSPSTAPGCPGSGSPATNAWPEWEQTIGLRADADPERPGPRRQLDVRRLAAGGRRQRRRTRRRRSTSSAWPSTRRTR